MLWSPLISNIVLYFKNCKKSTENLQMTDIVELKKEDVKGFWKRSELFRCNFSSGETKMTIEQMYLPIDISNLNKNSGLDYIVSVCEYWKTDTIPNGLIRLIEQFTDEEISCLSSLFIQDFYYVERYFQSLKDAKYNNVVYIPITKLFNDLLSPILKFKITGDVAINGRFKTLDELENIALKIKNLRRFLNPDQMRLYFSRTSPDSDFDFEATLISIINEDLDLLEYVGTKLDNRRFRIRTNSRMDTPEFSLQALADNKIISLAFQEPDIEKIKDVERMTENRSTHFSLDSFAAYLGKLNVLVYMNEKKMRFSKFTLKYAKSQKHTDCIGFISSRISRSRR